MAGLCMYIPLPFLDLCKAVVTFNPYQKPDYLSLIKRSERTGLDVGSCLFDLRRAEREWDQAINPFPTGPKINIMKKQWKITLIISLAIGLALVWYGESRNFYCLDKDRCITVWKTYNNTCYIIPGKYYGPLKPSDNYIQTTNVNPRIGNNYFDLYFIDEMANTILFRSEGEYEVHNVNNEKFLFLDFAENAIKYDQLLYKPDAQRANDLKENVSRIFLDTKDNYAKNKDGKRL